MLRTNTKNPKGSSIESLQASPETARSIRTYPRKTARKSSRSHPPQPRKNKHVLVSLAPCVGAERDGGAAAGAGLLLRQAPQFDIRRFVTGVVAKATGEHG